MGALLAAGALLARLSVAADQAAPLSRVAPARPAGGAAARHGAKPAAPVHHVAPSALELYRKSLASDTASAYLGREYTTAWRDSGQPFTTESDVSHQLPDAYNTTYLLPAALRGRVFVQNGLQRWLYIPGRNWVVHSAEAPDPDPPTRAEQLHLLLANYRLRVQQLPVQLAGRKAFLVTVTPRDPWRPSERLWIDPYTGIVLRREKYHAGGSKAYASSFASITFHPRLAPALFLPEQWDAAHPRRVEQPDSVEIGVDPSRLPPPYAGRVDVVRTLDGEALQGATLHGNGKISSLHLLYSDGLFPISLYVTPRRERALTRLLNSRPVLINPRQPARFALSHGETILSWDVPGMNWTLVGDASLTTDLRLADATGAVASAVAPRPSRRK